MTHTAMFTSCFGLSNHFVLHSQWFHCGGWLVYVYVEVNLTGKCERGVCAIVEHLSWFFEGTDILWSVRTVKRHKRMWKIE